jgi:hypothetical protein
MNLRPAVNLSTGDHFGFTVCRPGRLRRFGRRTAGVRSGSINPLEKLRDSRHESDREAANSNEGWKSAVLVGKAVALSAYDMLTQPEKLKAVYQSYKEAKAKEGK